jgi:bacterioferritin-associated ferredoxin
MIVCCCDSITYNKIRHMIFMVVAAMTSSVHFTSQFG